MDARQKKTNDFYIFLDIDGVMVNGHNPVHGNNLTMVPAKMAKLFVNPDTRQREQHEKLIRAGSAFNIDAVKSLNALKHGLTALGHKVNLVISSMWRHIYKPDDMHAILNYAGVKTDADISYTSTNPQDLPGPFRRNDPLDSIFRKDWRRLHGRGYEILEYLARNKISRDQFCVIDDEVSSIEPLFNSKKLHLHYSPIIHTATCPWTHAPLGANREPIKKIFLQEKHVTDFLSSYTKTGINEIV